ncbi:leucine-rich repeat domain-containing protein [Ascoidea rubescens DSM 1968]|uniref:L domain-like protein n=1 Tax=Ascoidea rubescens DSM 1968 TaxID=1344418 RepID=A0A1D2VRX6_9ASCO|nr:L domain-like protein [Ascoidea rubescens DSM 1968]XP_020050663.1 L domain-like protein [Ascoidea rubescens DSM 1968]ODV64348.1 L domain-like protein [Ascoidea rubescens DSM 1968]ODV64356.1 L domain-like protein [Ascoidea rubescens DSM 1968]
MELAVPKSPRQNILKGLPPHILNAIFTQLSFEQTFLFISSANPTVKRTCLAKVFQNIELITHDSRNFVPSDHTKNFPKSPLILSLKDVLLFKHYLNQFTNAIFLKVCLPDTNLLDNHQDIITMFCSVTKMVIDVQSPSYCYNNALYSAPSSEPKVHDGFRKCISIIKNLLLVQKHTLKTVIIDFKNIISRKYSKFQHAPGTSNDPDYHPEDLTDPQSLFSDECVNFNQFDLKRLHLNGMDLTEIESGVSKLKSINHFELRNNNFGRLENVCFSEMIKYLDLTNSKITSIKNVHFPKHLATLKLFSNKLKEFNNPIEPEDQIKPNLRNNSIFNIKSIRSLNPLSNLEELYLLLNLCSNRIKIVENIERLDNLSKINLAHNISGFKLVENKTCLRKLTTMNLSYNRISEISGLNCIKNLKSLDLPNNRIKTLVSIEQLNNCSFVNL